MFSYPKYFVPEMSHLFIKKLALSEPETTMCQWRVPIATHTERTFSTENNLITTEI